MEDFLLLDQYFSSEEIAWRTKTRQFVREDILPTIDLNFEQAIPMRNHIKAMADIGLLGMTLPHKYGGAGASYTAYGLACQELEYGDSSLRSFFSVQNSLCMYPILVYGSDAQKEKWLPKMARGEAVGCFALSEIEAGSDPASMDTTATKTTDGWELNGSKKWITNAPFADIAIIWARTPQNTIEAFLVEKNTPGFKTQVIEHKMSLRCSMTGEINLDRVKISADAHLPGSSKGLVAALECLTKARYSIAWGVIGAAIACFETALEYCKTRKQFHKPLAAFQLVQKDLAEMFTEINKAQCLNAQVGQLKDAGKSNYVIVSMAKMNACKQALHVARKARDLLGANGITLNYPVIRHMQNLEAVSTYEGTDNIHHLIIGKYLTGINSFE